MVDSFCRTTNDVKSQTLPHGRRQLRRQLVHVGCVLVLVAAVVAQPRGARVQAVEVSSRIKRPNAATEWKV